MASVLEQIILRFSGDNVAPCFHMLKTSIHSEFTARCGTGELGGERGLFQSQDTVFMYHVFMYRFIIDLFFELIVQKCEGQT